VNLPESRSLNTAKPRWQEDAEGYAQAGIPFEIKGIKTQQHRQFVLDFVVRHRWAAAHGDGIARLHPQGMKWPNTR